MIAPAFTVYGGLLTLLLLVTAHPAFLLPAYGLVGGFAAARLRAEAAPLPL